MRASRPSGLDLKVEEGRRSEGDLKSLTPGPSPRGEGSDMLSELERLKGEEPHW